MSSSRLFTVGRYILRPQSSSFPLYSTRFPSVSLQPFSTEASAATPATTDSELPSHPWPEWINFVNQLKTKGYFTKNTDNDMVYQEMNFVKDACLIFARDRYDILKSLSSGDLKAIVERGCPNILRKTVNSSKRIRAHVQLDEAEVCGSCELCGKCDRAYVIPKDSEADARTIDVMRVLMFNALDSDVIARGEIPPGRKLVHESARRLLLELVDLSEKPIDIALSKPSKPKNDEPSERAGTRYHADWTCPKCEFVNFARNEKCRECNEVADRRSIAVFVKEGDWLCPECNFSNFSRNKSCLKCKAKGPNNTSLENVEMKKGDWNCSGCGFMNFSSNKRCKQCRDKRPKRLLEPGEWECPSCDFVNLRRNTVCKKCECKRPSMSETRIT